MEMAFEAWISSCCLLVTLEGRVVVDAVAVEEAELALTTTTGEVPTINIIFVTNVCLKSGKFEID
jgi:hypothetical protein